MKAVLADVNKKPTWYVEVPDMSPPPPYLVTIGALDWEDGTLFCLVDPLTRLYHRCPASKIGRPSPLYGAACPPAGGVS